jgi:folate-binding protein YgfZ
MKAERYAQVLVRGGWVNLSNRAKWRLSGEDRVRYLNGQITQDVRRASQDETLYGCVTNAKGRIEGDVFFHVAPDGQSLLLDAEGALRETLAARLERYMIADDVALEDITEAWQLWHAFPGSEGAPQRQGGLASWRLGALGRDYWLPAGASPSLAGELELDEAEFEFLRAIPRYPNELNTEVFPQEAGLEQRAMSFSKGCYIGQEILSRIKSTGKIPHVLAAWRALDGGSTVPAGAALFDESGHAAGALTSVTVEPDGGRQVGLAWIRQALGKPDSVLLVGDGPTKIDASIQLLSLPNS